MYNFHIVLDVRDSVLNSRTDSTRMSTSCFSVYCIIVSTVRIIMSLIMNTSVYNQWYNIHQRVWYTSL